jgi:hypothetical protein
MSATAKSKMGWKPTRDERLARVEKQLSETDLRIRIATPEERASWPARGSAPRRGLLVPQKWWD